MVELVGQLDLDGIELDFDYPGKNYRFVYRNFVQGDFPKISLFFL